MTTPTIEPIVTESGMHALAREWEILWRAAPAATPFQSPAWLLSWWAQFGTGRPVLGIVRQGSRLIGLLPAYVLEAEAKLLPIGAGISDTLDVLLAPDAPGDAAAHLLALVLHAAGNIARCDLTELPPGSPLRTATPPPGWRATLSAGAACPVLQLPPASDLRHAIPAGMHRKLRMNRHRADRAGGFSVAFAGPTTLAQDFDALFGLHAARWTDRGEPGGVLADARVNAAIAGAAPGLLAAGVLRLAVLRIGPDIAAACLALLSGTDRLLLYMSGFSPAHAACSPGSVLLGALADQALAEGRRELHFLRGDEGYKYAWGATDQHNATRHLVRA